MEFSDTDYECVVSKIFDSLKHDKEKIPAQKVMKMIAPYIGDDRSEFLLLKDILDPFASNEKIDRRALKAALLQWTRTLKGEKDSCITEDLSMNSNYETPENIQYTSFCSLSSEGYRERISELQGEVAEREHHMRVLRRQLDHAATVTQQHEDALTLLVSEREQLRAELQVEQLHSSAATSLKRDYEELIDSLSSSKDKVIALQAALDGLKRENTILNAQIAELENEKHGLSQLLAQSKEDKKRVLKLLTTAQSDNEMLRQDCFQFNERIYEQEKSIQHLTSVKSSLEIHLQNQLNKSAHAKMQMDDSFEEKITKEANNLDFNFNQEPVRLKRMDSDISLCDETLFSGRNKYLDGDYITSTPRNHVSLMQELHQTPVSAVCSETTNYDNFMSSFQRICPQNCLVFETDSDDEAKIPEDGSFFTPLLGNANSANDVRQIEHTYVAGNIKKCSFDENDNVNYASKISSLEQELIVHKNTNKSLVAKLNDYSMQIVQLGHVVKWQSNRMLEMANYQALMGLQNHCTDSSMKEARVKVRMLRAVMEQRSRWLRQRLCNARVDTETQTDEQPFGTNALVVYTAEPDSDNLTLQQRVVRRIKIIGSSAAHKVLLCGTLLCFSVAYLQLFNTMKYCNTIRNGSYIRFYPWEWMSINEIVTSLFDFKYNGPVPI